MTAQRAFDESGGAGQDGPDARQPMFNLPAVIVWVLAIMWVVQLVRDFLLTRFQSLQVVIEGGFIPVRYSIDLSEQSLAWLWTPLTYSLLHGGFAHIIVNSVWLMAFGAVVARRIGTGRFLLFWLFSAVAAAGLYWVMNQGSNVPMIGASGVVSGLMGAAARFAFPMGGGFNRTDAHRLPRLSLAQAISNKTVLVYVAVWFGINALAAVGFAAGAGEGAQIAWEAHIGGFVFGFLLFPLFDVQPRR